MSNLFLITSRQQKELKGLIPPSAIRRVKSIELESSLGSALIKVVIGPRRAGKSTMVLQALQGKKFAYINLEDESLPNKINGDELIEAMDRVYGEVDYYFFDEIQNFPSWEKFLNRLHRLKKNIIVTGSNSQLLSEELSSSLTGRHIAIEVLPFSFKEAKKYHKNQYDVETHLIEGGFPEVVSQIANYELYLETLWDSIILKDIAKRKNVRNIDGLSNVLNLLLSNITNLYNVDRLVSHLRGEASAPTIKKFINYAKEAYLLTPLTLFNFKPRVRIKSDRKIYCIDNGVFNAKKVKHSKDMGLLLENTVFNELRHKGHIPNKNIFFYNTKNNLEIDFVIKKNNEFLEAIQVCASLNNLKTKDREIRALEKAHNELEPKKLTIITLDEEGEEKTSSNKKISIIPAHKWLSKK